MDPYYEADGITIYNGDALEVLAYLGPGCTDIVVTSPPYNMGTSPSGDGKFYGHATQWASRFTNDGYDGHSDAMEPAEYDQLLRSWLLACADAADRAVWFNHRPRVWFGRAKLPFDMDFEFLKEPTNDDFGFRQLAIWDRRQGTGTNAGLLTIRQEWVMLFCWEGFKMDRALTAFGDVWSLGVPAEKYGHPCPFPEELPARCIRLSSPRMVLDPFMGSGTTLVAAKRAGVQAIGIDQSETFCKIAAERLGATPQFSSDSLFGKEA